MCLETSGWCSWSPAGLDLCTVQTFPWTAGLQWRQTWRGGWWRPPRCSQCSSRRPPCTAPRASAQLLCWLLWEKRKMRVAQIQTTKSDLSGLRTRMTLRTFTTDTAPELRKEIATRCVIEPTWERMQHGWPQPRVDQEDLLHFCKSSPRAESVHLRLFSAPVRLWRLWWRNSQNSWEPEIFVILNDLRKKNYLLCSEENLAGVDLP